MNGSLVTAYSNPATSSSMTSLEEEVESVFFFVKASLMVARVHNFLVGNWMDGIRSDVDSS